MRKAFHITFNEATQLATRPAKPRSYKKSPLFWFNVWLATRKIRRAAIAKKTREYLCPKLADCHMRVALAQHFRDLGFIVLDHVNFYGVYWGPGVQDLKEER